MEMNRKGWKNYLLRKRIAEPSINCENVSPSCRIGQAQPRRGAGERPVRHGLRFEDFSAMAMFTRLRLEWLRQFLPLEHGAPSHDTFRYVFMGLDAEAFIAVLTEWSSLLAGRQIRIDGKASRGTFREDTGRCSVHLLRAWADEASLSVGQAACQDKRNEIEAIPRLLNSLGLEGVTVTIGAMGRQTAIAEQVDDAGGSYILALKGNQGQTHETVREHFRAMNRSTDACTGEQSHGRYEKRECCVESDLSFFGKSWKRQGLRCVVRVRRETCRGNSGGADGRESAVEDHDYLCSAPPEPDTILSAIRTHWGIENRCHWILDVVFGEDDSPVRDATAARNLSTLARHGASSGPITPQKNFTGQETARSQPRFELPRPAHRQLSCVSPEREDDFARISLNG